MSPYNPTYPLRHTPLSLLGLKHYDDYLREINLVSLRNLAIEVNNDVVKRSGFPYRVMYEFDGSLSQKSLQ
jgi:hypothetical protein